MKFLLTVASIIFALSFSVERSSSTKITNYEKVNYSDVEGCVFDSIAGLYARYGIKFPRVVAAQSIHETSFFNSTIYRENKNLFGMKWNKRGFASSVNRGHAKYASQAYSLMDYKAWQDNVLRLRPVDTEREYLELLNNLPLCGGCRYAEDLEYTDKVVRIIQRFSCDENIH